MMPALLCFPLIVLFFVKEEKENPEFHEKEKKKTLSVTTQGIIKAGTSDPTSERHRIGSRGEPHEPSGSTAVGTNHPCRPGKWSSGVVWAVLGAGG